MGWTEDGKCRRRYDELLKMVIDMVKELGS